MSGDQVAPTTPCPDCGSTVGDRCIDPWDGTRRCVSCHMRTECPPPESFIEGYYVGPRHSGSEAPR